MKIALVQMRCPKGTVADNLAAIARYIEQADADIVCFPEMSITGYIDPATCPEAILTLGDQAVSDFCALTRDTDVTAVAGIVEHNPAGKPFITQLVASGGELHGFYRKINVAEDELPSFAPGDATPIFDHRGVPFGVAICADVGHGDLFATYASLGAKLVLACAAPGLYGSQEERNWQSGFDWWRGECQRNLSEFARVGGIYITVATQAGRTVDEDFPGGGYAFDPYGERIAATPDWSEGILAVEMALSGQIP